MRILLQAAIALALIGTGWIAAKAQNQVTAPTFELQIDAPGRATTVRRTKRNQQCNRLREVSQPVTRCCDARLGCSGQRDRDPRGRGRVQRVVK
jgi:hypothetical protein